MLITETSSGCQVTHLCALDYGGMVPEWLANQYNRTLMHRLLGVQHFLKTFPSSTDRSDAIQKVMMFNNFYSGSKTARNSSLSEKCQANKSLDKVFMEWAGPLRDGALKHSQMLWSTLSPRGDNELETNESTSPRTPRGRHRLGEG